MLKKTLAILVLHLTATALLVGVSEGQAPSGVRPALPGVGDYPHWPAYRKVRVAEVRPQPWRNAEHIIDGWDWSLPPGTRVSDRSLLCVARNTGRLPALRFPANPVLSLWVNWCDLEPEEDRYEFDGLLKQIAGAERAGYSVVIRPITAVWKMVAHPDPSRTSKGMRGRRNCAPRYLGTKYNVPQIEERPKKSFRIINLDVSHPAFHKRYVKLVEAIGKSGIPRMAAVKGFIVGYASSSWGDEGVAPHGKGDAPHVIERLDAWAAACKGVEHKVCMCGTNEYGLGKGFGVRGGFVEMYLYMIPQPVIGQWIDDDGYLSVNEEAPVIKRGSFSGDENEEYDEGWTHRFGALESFTYRYFTSSLRVVQMRRNYLLHAPFSVMPEMLPFISQEMGRTVHDTPDVWCFLRESYIRAGRRGKTPDGRSRRVTPEERKNGTPCRNFERWLYQRDRDGFRTTPAVKVPMPVKQWMSQKDRYYDYVARTGARIGFAVDDRFLGGAGPHRVAVKISYIDGPAGKLVLRYGTRRGARLKQLDLGNTGKLKTATFFLDDAVFAAGGHDYDFTISGSGGVTVSFVRVIRLEPGRRRGGASP